MNFAPIPTEYKGNVFDSKSEAILARCFDLACVDWCYHADPENGHKWDFAINPSSRYNDWVFVEYKPTMPTLTYVKNLIKKTSHLPVESILIWGSFWNPPEKSLYFSDCKYYVSYPIFSSYAKYGWGDFNPDGDHGEGGLYSHRHSITDMLGLSSRHVEEAVKYRFDLRH